MFGSLRCSSACSNVQTFLYLVRNKYKLSSIGVKVPIGLPEKTPRVEAEGFSCRVQFLWFAEFWS